jgi:hypothetical protein
MNKYCLVILFALLAIASHAREYADTAIFQGGSIKLDIGMPVLELVRSAGKIQDYELAVNVRIAKRFYPTIEGGFAMAETLADAGQYKGQGGFGRLGMDMAVIKKGESENNLLVGLRLGGAYQGYQLTNVLVQGTYWDRPLLNFYDQRRFDCWGELVAGCQVQIYKGFQMGWYVRMKFLFTPNAGEGETIPHYVPGLGFRQDFNWGFNYYLGYRF